MTILLVDDSPIVIDGWKKGLAPLNAKILTASNTAEAIERMRTVPPPDLVFLDLRLSPDDPMTVARRIEALRDFNPNLAVIAISAMDRADILRAISGIKVEGVAVKHEMLSQDALLGAVKSAVAKTKNSTALLSTMDHLIEKIQATEPS